MEEVWLQVAALEQIMRQKQREFGRNPGDARVCEMYILYAHLWRTARAAAVALRREHPETLDVDLTLDRQVELPY